MDSFSNKLVQRDQENAMADFLLEDSVIQSFCRYLEVEGWTIHTRCLGRDHGTDITAQKGSVTLLVEAKGGKGNPKNGPVVREKFDSGQIKDHLGKAIVKVLELKDKNPGALLLIAHPFTEPIFRIVQPIAQQLQVIGITFAFLKENGSFIFIGKI